MKKSFTSQGQIQFLVSSTLTCTSTLTLFIIHFIICQQCYPIFKSFLDNLMIEVCLILVRQNFFSCFYHDLYKA